MEFTRNIYITNDIDEEVAEDVICQLIEIDAYDLSQERAIVGYEREPIVMFISSRGGYVDEGLAIYDAMQIIDTPIITVVLGFAYSMGFVIALGGDYRMITLNSRMMYHQISYGADGTHKSIKSSVKNSEDIAETMHKIVLERTNITQEKLNEVDDKNEDWYIKPDESIKHGICHEILTTTEVIL